MRRFRAFAAVLAVLALSPAAARASWPWSYDGKVQLPVVSSAVPRTLYQASGNNTQMFGDVFKLPPGADGKHYALTGLGATGLENVDAYFYEAGVGDYPGQACSIDAYETGAREDGTICPGSGEVAAWAVVILKDIGANARFTLTIG